MTEDHSEMTLSVLHALLLAAIGLILVVGVFLLMRRGLLAVRYGIGWAVIGILAVVLSPTLVLLAPLASALGLTVAGLAIAVGVGFLVLVCLQLSITLSGMQEQMRTLAEFAAVADAHARDAASAVTSEGGGDGSEDRQAGRRGGDLPERAALTAKRENTDDT